MTKVSKPNHGTYLSFLTYILPPEVVENTTVSHNGNTTASVGTRGSKERKRRWKITESTRTFVLVMKTERRRRGRDRQSSNLKTNKTQPCLNQTVYFLRASSSQCSRRIHKPLNGQGVMSSKVVKVKECKLSDDLTDNNTLASVTFLRKTGKLIDFTEQQRNTRGVTFVPMF